MGIDPSKIKVALLAGGSSGEREVSLKSGESSQEALKAAGFSVTMLDPARKGDLKVLMDEPFDVAFLCLHGRKGEDGSLQGFLEMIDLPYTGSHTLSSALAMDKTRAKVFYKEAGIPVAPSVNVYRAEGYDVQAIIDAIGSHCVVKPANEGSSLGVEIVEGAPALEAAIKRALELDDTVLVEQFFKGIEVTAAVLGNENPEAMPLVQMIPKNEFYDFESKYAPGGSDHLCPAPIDDSLTAKIQEYACRAHNVLGCSGVSRTDFMIDDQGKCIILETNTIPGMTETSLLPDAARVAGISFPDLCTRLVEYALV